MQPVENLGVKEVSSYTHDLYGQYKVEKVNGTFYKFIREGEAEKYAKFLPESEILNETVLFVNPISGGRKNRRATRKVRRNRKNYSRTN